MAASVNVNITKRGLTIIIELVVECQVHNWEDSSGELLQKASERFPTFKISIEITGHMTIISYFQTDLPT